MELIKNVIRMAWLAWTYVYHFINFGVKDTTEFVAGKDLDTKAIARQHLDSLLSEVKEAK